MLSNRNIHYFFHSELFSNSLIDCSMFRKPNSYWFITILALVFCSSMFPTHSFYECLKSYSIYLNFIFHFYNGEGMENRHRRFTICRFIHDPNDVCLRFGFIAQVKCVQNSKWLVCLSWYGIFYHLIHSEHLKPNPKHTLDTRRI